MTLSYFNNEENNKSFEYSNFIKSVRFTSFCWWFFSLILAGLLAWFGQKSEVNEDGLSYIEMASEAWHHGPGNLINGYWSPGYPALISCFFLVFHPSPLTEINLVHVLNYFIFIFTLLAFTFFFKNLLIKIEPKKIEKNTIILFASFSFSVFLWFELNFIGLTLETPDLLVSGFVFLYAGFCLKLSSPNTNWKTYAIFGILLGLGYYAKTVLLIFGIALIVLLFIFPSDIKNFRKKLLLTVILFGIISLPLIIAFSLKVGHFSTCEVGPLNYYWYVHNHDDNFISTFTKPIDPLYGFLSNPPKLIFKKPITLEFSKPITGTYPLWYDPSYWCSGVKNHFELGRQMSTLSDNLNFDFYLLTHYFWLFTGVITLIALNHFKKKTSIITNATLWLLIWPVTAMAIYALVHTEKRFLPAFFILFWLVFYHHFISVVIKPLSTIVLWIVLIATITAMIFILSSRVFPLMQQMNQPHYRPEYEIMADVLTKIGLKPGDKIASIGPDSNYFFAHVDGLHIAVQITDDNDYWNLDSEKRRNLLESLKSYGIKAITSINKPPQITEGDWQHFSLGQNFDQFNVLLLK